LRGGLRIQTAEDVFVGAVIILGRQLLEVTHHSMTPLQKVAKEPECHSREDGLCRAMARNPFFSHS
jgi:hypothetical protein